ncbi:MULTISPECIES: primosomal protein N' [unclassified Wenzhouxiangella]|uniref:primosomal protein N' n=1 Tax=unclassified Wenzhouxiangella TaxID=2613841 RepID=UPI000E32AC1F|nr:MULTISPECIES: primosomal protein N' [unclassified Wenzhouxiangella]RFF27324.1 primosomal protein N' [Wenzhouxiangella sp. 15181]RFP68757.1 primosomal protein N' [Wenzhouxiangella sp. 15190]
MSASPATVARVAVPVPLPRLFDYLPVPDHPLPPPGSRVLVPFGRRRLVGLVFEHGAPDAQSRGALRAVEAVLDEALIGHDLLELIDWCARYYVFPPGEAVNLLLPGALRRSKGFRPPPPAAWELTEEGRRADLSRAPRQEKVQRCLLEGPLERAELMARSGAASDIIQRMARDGYLGALDRPPPPTPVEGPALNDEQRAALAAVLHHRRRFSAFLLAGVTGSGKTEVYLQAARHILESGRQVLILAPEIGLTPQLVRRIESRLGETAHLYHSGLSEGERLACWRAARSGAARVIVGTRSAVFLPLARPGLIVVDEEHDASFKQGEGARYHARDVAVLRARLADIPVVLGTATPSLESLHNVDQGRYRMLRLARRAGTARQPRWRIVDQRGSRASLAPELVEAMRRHLGEGGQVLLYRNRRGYAPVLMCTECGWQADCERCSAHLTYHQGRGSLQCHHCGSQRPEPRRCPDCESPELVALGAGTERLESQVAGLFPEVPVHRVDRDAMSGKHEFHDLLEQVRKGEPCVLVGTQMLAKGHHLPGVTLAAVLDVDQSLFSADFRSPERLGQAVAQVAGRAGRGDRDGEFMLLTRHPEHPLLESLGRGDYLAYARPLLEERVQAQLPPASALAMLRAEAHQAEPARRFLIEASRLLSGGDVEVIGPLPAILARRGGYWRFQLWIQASGRARLANRLSAQLAALHELPGARRVRWHVDVDPLDL